MNKQKLTIEKLVFGGMGLARTEKGIVFVEGGLPGEVVDIENVGNSGGIQTAIVSAILSASPHRIAAPCKYYGICGGCNWQHIELAEQVRIKKEILLECFKRTGKISDIPDIEVIGSPGWKYRCRTQFKVDAKTRSIGFFGRKTNSVVPVFQCPLLVDGLNCFLKNQSDVCKKVSASCTEIKALCGTDESVASWPVLETLTTQATTFNIQPFEITVPGNSFFQSNRLMLQSFGIWVANQVTGDVCADVYGGVGFFSLFASSKISQGIVVESDVNQIVTAQQIFEKNGISNMHCEAASAENYCRYMVDAGKKVDTMIIDPPRVGLTETVRLAICRLLPPTLIYVSCDASTLARDVGYFVNTCRYQLSAVSMFDLYPHTHHIESVVVLKK